MAINAAHLCMTSSGTMDIAEDNPFALAPPSQGSKFDSKAAAHAYTMSNVYMGSQLLPKIAAHACTMSNRSMGSQMLFDNNSASTMTGRAPPHENHYSTTLELLRPKVLVMPSPLQSANAPSPPPKGRDGYHSALTK
ncbi:hypothetical protein GYMLUDRAFT_239822 [Collybiopsis luxurians FD-317 M1]|nr:hypothetical protein GYMLUDRAFT_239822 [Collybiopsis luxurians FD-317 M1]